MKSWISFLIPEDEYKEKKMLYFFSEGAILLFLFLITMIICNKYFDLNLDMVLMFCIAVFLIYVFGRYILSGIEYTDIATEQAYKKELKVICIKTINFVVIFMLLYFIFTGLPSNQMEWIEILGLLLSLSFLWFFTSFISLKRSYMKNKELL
ncbi:DUF3278 domain-containing protein [Oceanobacillus profundus]|uniref:DUF3278 domain-containing protein n=1 Tax=Oceanobacillus profundus TaxID=372463 RepID=A0A417Y9Z8_9BACI|nr:DUF3278 domain-containing protein [Oceanobacillus profundus]MCM3397949.1 DUF3278 domain-containing protein [Oceanobacillus profundus]PAE27438.1 hypothetical protein CHI07_19670 [Paenibacillus sp. 7884-2]RHW29520.1 DUF3278 domain-containing protein [Oceanobacillus profundus]